MDWSNFSNLVTARPLLTRINAAKFDDPITGRDVAVNLWRAGDSFEKRHPGVTEDTILTVNSENVRILADGQGTEDTLEVETPTGDRFEEPRDIFDVLIYPKINPTRTK